jgi:hypothetical protein
MSYALLSFAVASRVLFHQYFFLAVCLVLAIVDPKLYFLQTNTDNEGRKQLTHIYLFLWCRECVHPFIFMHGHLFLYGVV